MMLRRWELESGQRQTPYLLLTLELTNVSDVFICFLSFSLSLSLSLSLSSIYKTGFEPWATG